MKIIFILIIGLFNFDAFSSKTDTVELAEISLKAWVHTTYKDLNGTPFPSNGLVIETDKGLVLIDTPWNDRQTESLLQSVKDKTKKEVVLAIITHAHDDRIGGINALKKHHIKVISSFLTSELATKSGFPAPDGINITDTLLRVGDTEIRLLYPGPGHTKDNIVACLPEHGLLFAGCIAKSLNSGSLGNTADADITNWGKAIRKIFLTFPALKIVVPGHGATGDISLLNHTLKLIDIDNNK